jgi:dipeptidyl-peptidase-4
VASRVSGDLLLVHGSLDENVHRRHSTMLLEALRGAARDTELVLLEGQRHRTRGEAAIRLREQRTLGHLLRSLGLPLPGELAENA